ncbi:hypothetical protein ABE28_008905 [Peribacillus muralis]|uniref:Uncharacterized protein n=1 Tax=Peribacillus muralis TaxID=264697 RepID=A0A1B3XMR1_9BACI|nr:hypothetical protein [Peribacillus muralis]AOH54470.1 hypothetical protein ABE28_008905 [Peribacillus muralis]
MNIKTFEEASNLKVLIEAEERNIKGWMELFNSNEVALSSATKPQKMFLTGDKKEKVKEIIISENKKRLEEHRQRFESL